MLEPAVLHGHFRNNLKVISFQLVVMFDTCFVTRELIPLDFPVCTSTGQFKLQRVLGAQNPIMSDVRPTSYKS